LNIRKHATIGLLTIGLLVTLAASLKADDMAYMLGTAAPGVQNPLGIVDLNTGVFTLIGNMGSGGYDGLAVANGVLYTEQNGLLYSVNTSNANLTLIGGLNGNNLATFGSTTTGHYFARALRQRSSTWQCPTKSEHTVYDEKPPRIVNNNLAEYHAPTNADTGAIDALWIEEPDRHVSAMGAKGIGEIGITGSAAAVANAVYHATGED